jgi:dihydrofolate reductase
MSYADELIISKINKSYNCDVFMKCDFSKWNIAKLDESHPEFSITWYTSKK